MTVDDLYDEFEARLRRYAMSLAHDRDEADDLVQETLIRAMANLQLLELLNPHQRRSWLYRTLKNLFIDERRSLKRRQTLFEQLTQDADSQVSPPIGELSAELLDGTTPQDRTLIEQRYVLGMTSSEIAGELNIPAATVRSRLRLAIKRVKARLESEELSWYK